MTRELDARVCEQVAQLARAENSQLFLSLPRVAIKFGKRRIGVARVRHQLRCPERQLGNQREQPRGKGASTLKRYAEEMDCGAVVSSTSCQSSGDEQACFLECRSPVTGVCPHRLRGNSHIRNASGGRSLEHGGPQRGVSVDVAMAVQVRGRDACFDHPINLRRAFQRDVRGINAAETGTSNQGGHGIELAGFAPGQRTRGCKRVAGREIEVQAQRQRRARSSSGDRVIEPRKIHHHRRGSYDALFRRLDYSGVDAARESVVVGVYDEPSGTRRRSHAHRCGGRV